MLEDRRPRLTRANTDTTEEKQMSNEETRNLETIPVGKLGIIPLASCAELGRKVND